jgi:hypothetical protein
LKWQAAFEEEATFHVDRSATRPDGCPTVIDDDQRPVLDVNQWLLSLTSTSSSPDTWETYAREVVRFATWLQEHFNLRLLDDEVTADGDDLLRVYHRHCVKPDERDSTAGPVGDSKTTLGKRRAALTHFYKWAARTHRIEGFPFELVEVQTRNGHLEVMAGLRGGRRTSEEREPIPGAQLDRFLHLGLLGALPDGAPDPAFGGFAAATQCSRLRARGGSRPAPQ